MEGRRVKITGTPVLHGTGKGSRPCSCKGKTGVLIHVVTEGNSKLAFVRLDKGGRVGVPLDNLHIFGTKKGDE